MKHLAPLLLLNYHQQPSEEREKERGEGTEGEEGREGEWVDVEIRE